MALDFNRIDHNPTPRSPVATMRVSTFCARLSGLITDEQSLSAAKDAVPRNHDAIIHVTYLTPVSQLRNGKLLLSFDTRLASWADILGIFRSHMHIYHDVLVEDHNIMLFTGKYVIQHRINKERLFYNDYSHGAYDGTADLEADPDSGRQLSMFAAVVGRGFTHSSITGMPERGLVIVRGEEQTIFMVPREATIRQLGELFQATNYELFSPSGKYNSPNADRLAYYDEQDRNEEAFATNNGEVISAAPLGALAFEETENIIPRFEIRYHNVESGVAQYYDRPEQPEDSSEVEHYQLVIAARYDRDLTLRTLEAEKAGRRLRAELEMEALQTQPPLASSAATAARPNDNDSQGFPPEGIVQLLYAEPKYVKYRY